MSRSSKFLIVAIVIAAALVAGAPVAAIVGYRLCMGQYEQQLTRENTARQKQ